MAGLFTGVIVGPACGFLLCIGILEWLGSLWIGVLAGLACQALFTLVARWIGAGELD